MLGFVLLWLFYAVVALVAASAVAVVRVASRNSWRERQARTGQRELGGRSVSIHLADEYLELFIILPACLLARWPSGER